jgi:hypothetical protein
MYQMKWPGASLTAGSQNAHTATGCIVRIELWTQKCYPLATRNVAEPPQLQLPIFPLPTCALRCRKKRPKALGVTIPMDALAVAGEAI